MYASLADRAATSPSPRKLWLRLGRGTNSNGLSTLSKAGINVNRVLQVDVGVTQPVY